MKVSGGEYSSGCVSSLERLKVSANLNKFARVRINFLAV